MKSMSDGVTITGVRQARSPSYIFPLASVLPAAILTGGIVGGVSAGMISAPVAQPVMAVHSPTASRLGLDIELRSLIEQRLVSDIVERRADPVDDVPFTKRPSKVDRIRMKISDRQRHIALAEDDQSIQDLLIAHGY